MVALRCLLMAALGMVVVGCAGQPEAAVTGEARLNGQPLEAGFVRFVPAESTEGATIEATIARGAFAIERLPAGTYQLQVYAPRKTGRTITLPEVAPGRAGSGGSEEEFEETIPAVYNTRSTLQQTLTAGPNTVALELTSETR
ncbi:MAG: hypothetical protein AB7K24_30955 [Gemmataceae bacterium]